MEELIPIGTDFSGLQVPGRSSAPIREERHPRPAFRKILGMRVDATTYSAATAQVMSWARNGESRYVCEAPIAMVMEAHDAPDYQAVINASDLVTPGGMPIVWMMRRLGVTAQPRVYGPTMSLHVCEAAAREGVPVGFYGGTERAAAGYARRMQERYPGLKVVYVYSPPFRRPTPEEQESTLQSIRESGCRILFVGLGCPKQERWMAEHRGRIPAVMLGVGAAFDFLSGEKPQAPAWMMRIGMEWLFRFATEPRRLWYRYLYHNPRFVVLAARQLLFSAQESPSIAPELSAARPATDAVTESEIRALEDSVASKPIQRAAKRLLDVVGSGIALVLLAPVLLLFAVLIRLTSPGPVFYNHTRVGRGGCEFTVFKFRSMRIDTDPKLAQLQRRAAESGVLVKHVRDPRVTPIGRVLRSTSIDELPQLMNVLRGEMSLVGPRPLLPFMLAPFPAFARARAIVRPGLTGLWQIRERHNNTSALCMLPHDLEYIRRFSLWRDLVILCRTPWVVITQKGAC